MSNPAVNLATVLRDEALELKELCGKRGAIEDLRAQSDGSAGDPDRLDVAFSGGGIRSAAVNLGLIPALAGCDLLAPSVKTGQTAEGKNDSGNTCQERFFALCALFVRNFRRRIHPGLASLR